MIELTSIGGEFSRQEVEDFGECLLYANDTFSDTNGNLNESDKLFIYKVSDDC
jgi:hypothetical protein